MHVGRDERDIRHVGRDVGVSGREIGESLFVMSCVVEDFVFMI